jgi:hypothetical protein
MTTKVQQQHLTTYWGGSRFGLKMARTISLGTCNEEQYQSIVGA